MGKRPFGRFGKVKNQGTPVLLMRESESDKTSESKAKSINNPLQNDTFTEWCWRPESGNYEVIIRFADAQSCDRKLDLIQGALKEVYKNFADSEMQEST